jgi:hypothetical protein
MLAATIAFTACTDALVAPDGSTFQKQNIAVHVNSLASLKSALASGYTWLIIDQPIEFWSASDRILLDDYSQALQSNVITIEGGGDWKSAVFRKHAEFAGP